MGSHEMLLQLLHSENPLQGGDCCHDTEFWRLRETKQGKEKGGIQSSVPH